MTTPEMFAEWREPGLNCLNSPAPAERGGAAFIQAPRWLPWDHHKWKDYLGVPQGYVWQPATDHSPAGWVRPLTQRTSIPM